MKQILTLLILGGLLTACGSLGSDPFVGVWAEGTAECADTYLTIEKNDSVYIVSFLIEGEQERKGPAVLEEGVLNIVDTSITVVSNDNGTELSAYYRGKEEVYQRTTNEQQQACDHARAGLAAFEAEEFDEAIRQYTQALALNPNSADSRYNLGVVYYKEAWASDAPPDVSLLEEAIVQFKQVIEMDSTYQAAYAALGEGYSVMEEYDLAIPQYKEALALKPDDVNSRYNLGLAYSREAWASDEPPDVSLLEEGIVQFKQVIEMDSTYQAAYADLGASYSNMKEYELAITQFKQALALKPDDVNSRYNLGVAYFQEALASDEPSDVSLLEEAIAQFKQVIEMDSTYQAAYVGLGKSYFVMEEYELAITQFKQALALKPDDVDASLALRMAYSFLSSYDGGVEIFKKILQATPDDTEARSYLAFIYAQKERFDKAIEQHQLILEEQPENFGSLQNLAVLYQQTEQWQLALEMAEKAMALDDEEHRPEWEEFIAAIEAELAKD